MPKIAVLKPDSKLSIFICKAYFDRPNIYDATQNQQTRFFSFDYPQERQQPPKFEELKDEQKMLRYNGYAKIFRWIEKARQDRKFKHAYIYVNHIHDEDGKPLEIRLFLPYKSETNQHLLQNLNKPHWQHSIFKMVVYYKPALQGQPDEFSTHYSRDLDIERENPPTSAKLTTELKKYRGYQYLAQKAVTIQQNPKFKLLILYANLLGDGKGVEVLRVVS
ncbi:MAG: hypothetical protein ACPGJS_00730 [Flammeovirgaceae bacterium]